MKVAIAQVFPNTRHRLCIWHIKKKFVEKLSQVYFKKSKFKKDVKICIWATYRKEDFEKRWIELMKENGLENGFVTSTTNLKEFVVKDDQALKRIVKRENDEDFESEHKFRIVNDNEFLLKHGAKIYTRNVFNKFNDEMSGVFHYKVEEVGNANGIQSFIVKSKEHEVKKFEVPLDLQTYMGVCECQNFEFVGILCTHILRQKANKFRIIDSEGLVHDDGKEESEALRLGHMCQESTKLACLAAPSNEAYMIYIEAMNDLSKKLLKVPKNTPNLNLIVLDPILMI
ncbi:hypothetical protein RHGRI_007884 [Rhododendron griersonianum]|uniref:Protein FAR1-RELATED SEQUENCE n=1 Tax=Rhododendron griersonianum TaxID=479676 RepID=A0AAV6KZT1_9ERIC|nr:hypothetical protein RHGRI_007884 [Rhododendron griersonianum]